MKKQSKLLALLLACAMTLALSACGGNSATTSTPAGSAAPAASGSAAATGDKTYTIGICQLVQHNALDAATKGFKDALTEKLGDKVKFDEQNAAGDSATCATICKPVRFQQGGSDYGQRYPRSAGCHRCHQLHSHPGHLCHRLRHCTVHRRLEGHHWHQRHRHR